MKFEEKEEQILLGFVGLVRVAPFGVPGIIDLRTLACDACDASCDYLQPLGPLCSIQEGGSLSSQVAGDRRCRSC